MHFPLAALCALSSIGVCFMARIPGRNPKFSLSNLGGSLDNREPVFDSPPFFWKYDEVFDEGIPFSPPERKNPDDYDFRDFDYRTPPVEDFNSYEIDLEESVNRIPQEKPKGFDKDVPDYDEKIPNEDKEVFTESEVNSGKDISEADSNHTLGAETDSEVESDKDVPEDDDPEHNVGPEKDSEEESDKDTSEDDDSEHKIGPEKDFEEDQSQPDALPLGSPFFDIDQMRRYFDLVERAMDKVFRQTIEEALALNGTAANTTEEEVDVDGHKYKVLKSIIKSGDHNSTILIEAVETTHDSNRTKRSNWYSEEAEKAADSDP